MRTKWWVPWMYVGPALVLVAIYQVYPAVNTFILSFFDRYSRHFIGLTNYLQVFTQSSMLIVFRNNALWLFGFTILTVGFGLLLAVLLDRVRYESFAKSVIFLPMAISMVGASVIWKFVYAYRPAGTQQIGLLDAIVTAFGGQPVAWLTVKPWNNFFLIIIGAWIWTGFAMVVLSAAYKNIPVEMVESARLDGANERQIFGRITLPLILPTIAVVTTTIVVFVLKIFDVVYVVTNGDFDTDVIANAMFNAMFQFQYFGEASTLATILFVLTIPIIIINIRRLRREEEAA